MTENCECGCNEHEKEHICKMKINLIKDTTESVVCREEKKKLVL